LEGFDRIEAQRLPESFAHLFSQWDRSLEAVGVVSTGVFAHARAGAGSAWISRCMQPDYDAFSPPDQLWPPPLIWAKARSRIQDREHLLMFRLGPRMVAVHSKNIQSVLGASSPEVQHFCTPESRVWLWNRGSLILHGRAVPILNTTPAIFMRDSWDQISTPCALIMPWQLPDGALCSWALLLPTPPRTASALECDRMVEAGTRLLFVNEHSLLGFCAQAFDR
jgi:hypothetical protein